LAASHLGIKHASTNTDCNTCTSFLQREALENALKQLWVLDALDIDGGIKHA